MNDLSPKDTVENLDDLSLLLMKSLEITERTHKFKKYQSCFIGSEAVEWMVDTGLVGTTADAVLLGQQLLDSKYIYHVTKDHDFKDGHYFYRFSDHDDKGRSNKNRDGKPISWHSLGQIIGHPTNPVEDKGMNTSFESTALKESEIRSDQLEYSTEMSPLDVNWPHFTGHSV
jgi:hypothetical protein